MTTNSDLMNQAKASLEGNWGISIGTLLVFILVSAGSGIIPFGSLVIAGPLALGYIIFNKKISAGEEAKLESLFDGFQNFLSAMGTYLLVAVLTFLWSLLLIIPGIIMALAYSQAMYILSDDPEIGAFNAIKKSKEMMDGYKMKLFGLILIFMLLSMACILTLGIGYFFLIPFMQVTMVKFYNDVKGDFKGSDVTGDNVLDANI